MRGTLTRESPNHTHCGLIPTYAGNTHTACFKRFKGRAHPHVCGEHLASSPKTPLGSGSSPRMRGTHRIHRLINRVQGLIPTYAGNTRSIDTSTSPRRAHPHVCGEHKPASDTIRFIAGSSPRMRGTHNGIPPTHDASGLIPTYAGNTNISCC